MAGVNLDKEVEKKKETDLTTFKDPESYEHMSIKDRRKLTMEMLKRIKPKLSGSFKNG